MLKKNACSLPAPLPSAVPPGTGRAFGLRRSTPANARIAAVVPRRYADVDDLIAGFAIGQINQGHWVRGLVQETQGMDRSKRLTLVDLDDGSIYPISQFLGTLSISCRIDSAGVADACQVMHRIAAQGADLAIFNRFGGLEAQGGGFAAEMLRLMAQDIPVLTVVPERFLDDWQHFTGGLYVELPPSKPALESWFQRLIRTAPARAS